MVASLIFFALEAANALTLCFLGSEWLVPEQRPGPGTRPPWRHSLLFLVGLPMVCINVLVAGIDSFGSWPAWSTASLDFKAVGAVPIWLLVSAFLALAGMHWRSAGLTAALLASAGTVAAVIVWALDLSAALSPISVLRTDVVACAFVGACYWDLCHRQHPHTLLPRSHFLPLLARAVTWIFFLFPLLAIAIAVVFLAIAAVVDALAINHDFLQRPVYFGVLYGPWAGTYLLMKRWARKNQADLPR